MKIKDLIKASRSFRSFDPNAPITAEILADLVECVRYTPSSRNLQALKFRLVTSKEECAAILPFTRWAGLLRDMEIPPRGHAPTAYVVITIDTSLTENITPFLKDVGICAQSILLAATEAGFGGCMIGSFHAEEVSKLLSLPAHLSPQLILAMGKPDETVMLTDVKSDGSIAYYRENGVHYVPKRPLEDLIIS